MERFVDVEAIGAFRLPAAPLFIVGHWRSGTTLLHELLCCANGTAYPSTYACMNPLQYLLGGEAPPRGPTAVRPMDGVVVRGDRPQEDEFALFSLGAPSPYQAFLHPRGQASVVARASPANWSEEEGREWNRVFRLFCSALERANPSKLHIFKSPPHSLRIDLIREILPGARFIRVVRRPEEVFASTLAMWRAMWEQYAIGPAADPDTVREAICSSIIELDAAIDASFSRMPGGFITVRFEDVLDDPVTTVADIAERLVVPQLFGPPQEILARAAQAKHYPRGARPMSADETALIRARCLPLISRYGDRH